MIKSFNITRNELKGLIREAIRKISLLNESVKEGGAAGHMMHPFDVDEFTFGDYKQLVEGLFGTGLERIDGITEKLDGMNIFATVTPDGEPRFARNAGQIKGDDAGMGIPEMEARWGGEGKDTSILDAYKNAFYLFSDAVSSLRDPAGFFNGDGYRLYANCEVIDKTHPNAVPYAKTVLSVHNLVAFSTDGTAQKLEIPEDVMRKKMDILKQVLPTVQSQYGGAQVTPQVMIAIREDSQEMVNNFIAVIDHIEDYADVDDNTTLIQYRETMLTKYIADHGFEILLNNQFTEYFINRWVYGQKQPTIVQLKKQMLTSGLNGAEHIYDAAVQFEKEVLPEAMKEIMEPIENFFYRLGNKVIASCKGLANEGSEDKAVQILVNQLENTQEMIRQSNDPELMKEMTYWLYRLSTLDNKYNAAEGVVFNWRGKTMKLTGSFAALNRAINLRIKLQRKQKNQA
jgi:hypothetical protein